MKVCFSHNRDKFNVLIKSFSPLKTSENKEIKISPHESATSLIGIDPSDYVGKFSSTKYFNVQFKVIFSWTKNAFWEHQMFIKPNKPKLVMSIKPEGCMKVKHPSTIVMSFTNPLDIPLTECEYVIESPGVIKRIQTQYEDIPRAGVVKIEHKTEPFDSGENKLVSGFFYSKELTDLRGQMILDVTEE